MRRLVLLALALAATGCGGPPDGAALFRHRFTVADGLGPLFNRSSCASCHALPAVGGTGRGGLATALRAGRLAGGGDTRSSVPARAHSTDPGCPAGIPGGANVTSVRNAPSLFGTGRIAAIPDAAIRAVAAAEPATVRGRPNRVGGQIGRFGWKADVATLDGFVTQALHDELGVTSPDAADSPCEDARADVDREAVHALSAYVAGLRSPDPPRSTAPGAAVFTRIGCGACHTPELAGVPAYSDLLLHDMGPALDDRMTQGSASGREWRTAPLWGLGERSRFLHDGRAASLEAGIRLHGGQAAEAARRFRRLSRRDRTRLLAFLAS